MLTVVTISVIRKHCWFSGVSCHPSRPTYIFHAHFHNWILLYVATEIYADSRYSAEKVVVITLCILLNSNWCDAAPLHHTKENTAIQPLCITCTKENTVMQFLTSHKREHSDAVSYITPKRTQWSGFLHNTKENTVMRFLTSHQREHSEAVSYITPKRTLWCSFLHHTIENTVKRFLT